MATFPRCREGLRILESAGAERFIHCGDVGGLSAVEELAGRPCWFVWGNTDVPEPRWRALIERLGLPWPNGPLELKWDGRQIAVFHGHEPGFSAAVHSSMYDYLFYGHTHHQDDQRIGKTRVINPVALFRVAIKTVALLDLDTDELSFLEVNVPPKA